MHSSTIHHTFTNIHHTFTNIHLMKNHNKEKRDF